jgi:hypothetical protein
MEVACKSTSFQTTLLALHYSKHNCTFAENKIKNGSKNFFHQTKIKFQTPQR